ncbi:hypothetical protein RUND412_006953 [Rhizina undulata]
MQSLLHRAAARQFLPGRALYARVPRIPTACGKIVGGTHATRWFSPTRDVKIQSPEEPLSPEKESNSKVDATAGEPPPTAADCSNPAANATTTTTEGEFIPEHGGVEEVTGGGANGGSGDRPVRRGRPAGSKSRARVTNSESERKETPKPELPVWFFDAGVILSEDAGGVVDSERLGIYSDEAAVRRFGEEKKEGKESVVSSESEAIVKALDYRGERYQMHENVWKEIVAHVRAGLILPKSSFLDSFAALKSHCLLHFPKEGGVYYLDAVTEKVAAEVGADLVRIDAQDLEEIAGDFLGDSRHVSSSGLSSFSIRSLGYDTQLSGASRETGQQEEDIDEESEDDALDEEDTEMPEQSRPASGTQPKFRIIGSLPAPLQQLLMGRIAGAIPMLIPGDAPFQSRPSDVFMDRENEQKVWTILEALISAGQAKRAARKQQETTDEASVSTPPQKTIIHIRDYRELERTPSGAALLRMLQEIVLKRRKAGESFMIFGTTSTEETSTTLTRANLRSLQTYPEDTLERTIVVPPIFDEISNVVFEHDKESRTKEINIRHIRDVIRRRSGENEEPTGLIVPPGWHLRMPEDDEEIPGIEEKIWTFDRVHRVAITALGHPSTGDKPELSILDIKHAVEILDRSDSTKFAWAAKERRYLREREEEEDDMAENEDFDEEDRHATGSAGSAGSAGSGKPKAKLPKNCTSHEKKLLSGVINPENIHTGFSSVRAPEETIEALKTLTSLSLIRPEAFKYGVLATDRIPGVLLYGPPGTGKTLLAKAVAKESGATVLEVSGSEIFDMYVGEGEKNVKAIFSLAQKLSPCVVFIDEADAIFGSRHSHSTRTSHREIINQFLKEWADLQSTAFIMVATNRPFDLDDAVLRRLPRRILIDLPTLADRLAILQIHLAAETLSPSVDLSAIAEQTTLYSGSDLKNLCVAAALACVREENADAARARERGEKWVFPAKRVLEDRHFKKALGEITASISDDMSSLTAIRKFDEKYGEKSGGRRKKVSWGFGMQAEEVGKGTGRVREG